MKKKKNDEQIFKKKLHGQRGGGEPRQRRRRAAAVAGRAAGAARVLPGRLGRLLKPAVPESYPDTARLGRFPLFLIFRSEEK